jgi:hypothetical protein
VSKIVQFLVVVVSGTAAAFFAGWAIRGLWRNTKKRSMRAGGFFWAIQFLGIGEVPPPTPQEQSEQENREKKNRGAADKA